MSAFIRVRFRLLRVERYLDNVRSNIKGDNLPQALADCAELAYQAKALYAEIEDCVKQKQPRRG